eukprot:6617658-Prymnesium_polylepis.1
MEGVSGARRSGRRRVPPLLCYIQAKKRFFASKIDIVNVRRAARGGGSFGRPYPGWDRPRTEGWVGRSGTQIKKSTSHPLMPHTHCAATKEPLPKLTEAPSRLTCSGHR